MGPRVFEAKLEPLPQGCGSTCPALPLLPPLIVGTILVSGSQPGLLGASPGRNGDGQAPPAAARLDPSVLKHWCEGPEEVVQGFRAVGM